MQAENHTLNQRQVLGEEGVEDGDKEHNGDGEQRSVPSLIDVAVVIEDDETLDFGCGQKTSN